MTSVQSEGYHQPVLAEAVVTYLVTEPNGAYLDLTVGGGGHTAALAERLGPEARIYGVDRDPEALETARRRLAGVSQVRELVKGTFADIERLTSGWRDRTFHGVLLDLGVSSHQIDDARRGFSFSSDGPLDMRMDPSAGETAAHLLGRLEARELAEIIREYGEERMARRIAEAIVRERQRSPIRTTAQLAALVRSVVPPAHVVKSLARVFQALRIAVNRELDQLRAVLPAAFGLLVPGGRLAVIAYHSLEDRQVKQFFRRLADPCTCPPGLPVCRCGAVPTLRILTKRPVRPDAAETTRNPRARSARLRVGERL